MTVREITGRCRVLIVVATASVSCLLYAHSNEENFLRANRLYEQGEFSSALQLYSALERKGTAVWFNLGNTQYALGDVPHAIAAWKRAQRDASACECKAIRQNLDNAYVRLGLPSAGFSWREEARCILAYGATLVGQVLFFLLWSMLLWGGCFLCRRKKYFIFGLLVLATGGATAVLIVHVMLVTHSSIIITAPNAMMRAGNGTEFHGVMSLKPGQEASVLVREGEWLKVTMNKRTGWIADTEGEIVGPLADVGRSE